MSTLNQVLARRIAKRLKSDIEVIVEPSDFGSRLGVAIRFNDVRHAVRAQIDDGDLTKAADEAADALDDWLSSRRND